jgi:hypothetical protein
MFWSRLGNGRTAHRVATVDGLLFPAGGRQRLVTRHSHLSDEDIRLIEAATRQWFRVVARNPGAKLSMPSVAVDDLWRGLALHEREYAAFCDAAFGRLLHPPPTSGPNRAASLLATLGHARRDEGRGPTGLPLLFLVDQNLRIRGGNRYLADCGGRGECFQVPGMICLQHVGGLGKRLGAPGIRGDLAFHDGRHGYAGGAFEGGGGGGE